MAIGRETTMQGKTRSILLLVAAIILTAIAALSCSSSGNNATPATLPTATGEKVMSWKTPPAMQIDKNKKYMATIQTEKGNLVLELFAKDVPNTVNNFVFLATQGFYDGTTFHRVIPDFMVQGGDPTGTGMGDPGYKFADEFTSHKHAAGSLSMANSGPGTNGSQFFITYVPTPWLDGKHTVFGQLTAGMDVLKKITPRDPATAKTPGDKIIKVTLTVQ
jgi:cyclophilin family peptidyl-prolyl cis-trans isomerase